MKKNNYKKFLKPSDLVDLLSYFKQLLSDSRAYLDSLNVFPVPDGDTGANMYLTMESVLTEIDGTGIEGTGVDSTGVDDLQKNETEDSENIEAICGAAIKGAVMGARGNSGVLLSQILKGFLETFKKFQGRLGVKAFTEGAKEASKCAYEAVSEPVEGTILTVMNDISKSGNSGTENSEIELAELSTKFQVAGAKSLANTPNLLEALKKAGVVDAGGAGLVLLFDALAFVVKGETPPPPPEVSNVISKMSKGAKSYNVQDDRGTRYEVMFLLNAQEEEIPAFRQSWEQLGDSIAISGAEGIWNCHIHTNEIGKSIEAGIVCGSPHDVRVTDLYEQVDHNDQNLSFYDHSKEFLMLNAQLGDLELDQAKTHILVTGQGEGLANLFSSLGARVMIVGGQTQNPSTRVFLDAIEQVEAEEVVILPNNSNICAVANSVAAESKKPVSVAETKTISEGVSVLMAYDPLVSAQENAAKMSEAKEDVVSGQVTRAVRDSDSHGVSEGDFIGLDSKDILCASKGLVKTTANLLKKLVSPDHEFLMLIAGREAQESESKEILTFIEEKYKGLEVEFVDGGQDLYHYYIVLE